MMLYTRICTLEMICTPEMCWLVAVETLSHTFSLTLLFQYFRLRLTLLSPLASGG